MAAGGNPNKDMDDLTQKMYKVMLSRAESIDEDDDAYM